MRSNTSLADYPRLRRCGLNYILGAGANTALRGVTRPTRVG
jgi:hypothetical protein